MTKKEIRNELNQDLVTFLKKQKCLCKYINNCYKQQFIHSRYSKCNDIQRIITAFRWKLTPERSTFWNNLYLLSKTLKFKLNK